MKVEGTKDEVSLKVENDDDLWHLSTILSKGDIVESRSQRNKKEAREKKSIRIRIEIEKMDYQGSRLRLTGEMIGEYEGVDIGYHSLNIEKGTRFKLYHTSEEKFDRLEEVARSSGSTVGFCIMSNDRAEFFRVRDSGIEKISEIENSSSGKMYDDGNGSNQDYRGEVASRTEKLSRENIEAVVLAGPGFAKKEVRKVISENDLGSPLYTQDTSVTGRRGLHECFNRGIFERVQEDSRIQKESAAVKDFLDLLERGDEAVYGEEKVRKAARIGAAEKVLMTVDEKRENEDLAETAKDRGSQVITVHTDHELGERLENFGGLAAVLRYPFD